MSCDFEDSSICGYGIGDKFVWQEGFVHYLPSIDHTYGNESGMCMDFTDFFSILIWFDQMKNKKYHTVGTVPKSSRKIVDKGKIDTSNKQIHNPFLAWYRHFSKK